MEEKLREFERHAGRRTFRGWWLDFLETPEAKVERFPFQRFILFYNQKLVAVMEEKSEREGKSEIESILLKNRAGHVM